MERPPYKSPRHEEFYDLVASRIEGVTDLPSFIRAASNNHWIWKGQNSPRANYSYVRYMSLNYNVAHTLATFPIPDDRGFSANCFRHRCVNPWHAITLSGNFFDINRPVEMLARYGSAYCKSFIPNPLALKRDIIEFAYNPDPEIWTHRVVKILRCSHIAAREMICE